MTPVGRVQAIWRYPVKGMAGESLASVSLDAHGLVGDREWAMRETARREIQSCKRHPLLLQCRARTLREPAAGRPGRIVIRLPDGQELDADQPELAERLEQLTGVALSFEPRRPADDTEFYRRYNAGGDQWLQDLIATFEREPGEPLPDFSQLPPEAIEFVAAPGHFQLVAPLHIVTTATLRQLRDWHAGGDCDVRRFRPNLVIETEPGAEGLVEQRWIGRRLVLGGAAIDCTGTTPRCGAITRAQGDLPFDAGLLRTVVKQAEQNVGVYGAACAPGAVQVGDLVMLE